MGSKLSSLPVNFFDQHQTGDVISVTVVFTQYRFQKERPLCRSRSQKLGELNGFAEEIMGGQRTAKAYGREPVFLNLFEQKNEEAVESNYKADCFSSMTGPSVNFANNLSLALISIFGAMMYMGGSVGIGSISSFVLYSRKFSGPINEFANIISELQSPLAAAERVLCLIDEDALSNRAVMWN